MQPPAAPLSSMDVDDAGGMMDVAGGYGSAAHLTSEQEELLFTNESFDDPHNHHHHHIGHDDPALEQHDQIISYDQPAAAGTGRPRAGSLDDEDFSALVAVKQQSPVVNGVSFDSSGTTAPAAWYNM